MNSEQLLEHLSNAIGTPGNEGEIRDIIRSNLKTIVDFSYDKLGSIICSLKNNSDSKNVMLAAHMDEVGFIVRSITENGYLKFTNLGGWWNHTLPSQKVTINGHIGIIGSKPVHHLDSSDRNKIQDMSDMFIDIGAKNKGEAEEKVSIGDHVVPLTCFSKIGSSRLLGKAFDNRVGVALMIEALKYFHDKLHPNNLIGAGTVQEEVGTRGARTSSFEIKPDLAIVLEGPPADDTPSFNIDESNCVLGKGPQIRLFDPTAITNKKFSDFVVSKAKKFQLAVRTSGGTDAKEIHLSRSGVPTIVLGVPVRYAHSHVGLLDIDDYKSTLSLLIELIKNLNSDVISSFTDFSKS